MHRTILLFSLLLSVLLSACSKDPKAREWKPEDHDQPGESPAAVTATANNNATAGNAADDVYRSSCSSCHGADGRGDTPMGRSMRVPDFTSADWHQKATDEQLAETISNGRGRMPAFNMPPAKVDSLVKKVRSFRK